MRQGKQQKKGAKKKVGGGGEEERVRFLPENKKDFLERKREKKGGGGCCSLNCSHKENTQSVFSYDYPTDVAGMHLNGWWGCANNARAGTKKL